MARRESIFIEERISLVRRMFNYHNLDRDELILGGIPLSKLLEKYDTPLYVYDGEIAETKFQKLGTSLI